MQIMHNLCKFSMQMFFLRVHARFEAKRHDVSVMVGCEAEVCGDHIDRDDITRHTVSI